jgi:predicted permease
MTNVVSDLRLAARTLWRSPLFFALAVVTLAVGIGGTTALFSLVDAVLLRPLPFTEPERLVEIWGRDDTRTGMRVPGVMLSALRERSRTLQAIGTHDPMGAVLRTADGAVEIIGEAVSANFVDVFGVAPLYGRGFLADEERPGSSAVLLVSYAFWQQHLGGDSAAVGRTIYFDTVPYTVIGIMPPTFRTNFLNSRAQFWTPFAGSRSRERERELGYEVVARLYPGVSVEQSRREIEAVTATVVAEDFRKAGRRLGLVPLKEEVVGNRAYALMLLMAAVGLVLAIACANLAQLLLARSDSRLTEFATRKAMGAGSFQLFRLALSESVLLSAAGGVAGIVLAYWLVPLMIALAPSAVPRLADATVDLRVMMTALAITLLTGCAFGMAPAVRLSRLSVVQAMKPTGGSASKQRARFRSVLVVMQVASAVTLVALAGLVVRTFVTLLPSAPGFATASRAAFIFNIPQTYPDPADRRRRIDDLLERVQAVPGIAAAAFASSIPFDDDEPRRLPIRRPEDVEPVNDSTLRATSRAVSLNALELLEIPLMRGRSFAATDGAEAPPVAIVNDTLARRLGGDVVGQSVRLGATPTSPVFQIVGVVADTRWWGTSVERLNEVYTPLAQHRPQFGCVVVQSPLEIATLSKAIRASFYAAFPGAPLRADQQAVALDEMIDRSLAGPRFGATLMGAFSLTALGLAVIGLFGLVAYSVSQRRQELGIRTALGARPVHLIATALRTAIGLTATGIVLGIAVGTYLTRFVETQLYSVEPLVARTFAGAAIIMLAAGAVAAYIPARSVVRNDPMAALRYE